MPAWVPWVLAATLCWGVWGAFAHSASAHGSPWGQVAGAVLIEAVLVLPLAGAAWKARSWPLVGMSVAGLVAYALFFKALSLGNNGPVIVAIGATYPIITYVIFFLFFGGRMSWRASLGIALAVAGTALLSSAGTT